MFKNLFQQFQRAANVYFLVIGCLQLDAFFPGLSPTHWSTTIGPLLVVLSINAAKEAVDDYGRHKSDAEVNARTVEVVRVKEESPDGKKRVVLESTAWRDLNVGDVAKVRADAEIPADLLLVASADVSSLAYVETANLDGETNLKVKTTAPIEGAREALRELDNADALVSVFTQKTRAWRARRPTTSCTSSRASGSPPTILLPAVLLKPKPKPVFPRTTCSYAARRFATRNLFSASWCSPAETPS